MSSQAVEILARGVCIQHGQLLLCHTKDADNTYLPGGHVEFGESAKTALTREIREEMGLDSTVIDFLGVVEHTFEQNGETHCEVNLLFALNVEGLKPDRIPKSCERHIDFLWVGVAALDASTLEPEAVRSLIGEWSEHGSKGGWGSNLSVTD